MPTKLNRYLIYFILLLAVFLRAYRIDTLPSLNPDEAALGYNAYSLLQTGKDEHGLSWPLHFKSFGDYKPGGYIYLDLPFIKAMGLTTLAVRLPNLIFSVLTIFVLFKLVQLTTYNSQLSTLTAFVLAVNPWHIHFSRGAWESCTALFFLTLGIYWFYSYTIKHKTCFAYLFPLPLIVSLYVYHSVRLIAPVLFLILLISNYSLVISNFKKLLLPLLIATILTVPVLISFLNHGGTTRFGGVGLTADHGPIDRAEELLNQHGNTSLINRIIHNKRTLYTISWAQKYVSHFDLNFLFINGDDVPRSKSPDIGQFYLFELPFLILGIIYVLKSKTNLKQVLFPWLLAAPLASSLTFQAPSALRALSMTVPLSVFVAAGLYYACQLVHRKIFILLIVFLYIYSLAYFLDAYFIHAPKRYSFAWNAGFNKVIPYVESQKNNFQHVYFTDKYDQPYILYLFFSKYPPQKFQPQSQLTPPDKFGFSTVTQIDNITFKIPDTIPENSLVVDAADFEKTGQSFKIYTK